MSKAITVEQLRLYQELGLPEELTKAARDPKERALVSILGRCFVGATETTQVKTGDIDYQREALSIMNLRGDARMICPCGERLAKRYRFCPACGRAVPQALQGKLEEQRKRIVPISHDTLDLIEKYLEWRRRFPYRGELLFPFTRQRIWQIIERHGRKIGAKGLHPSGLRHLLAARWINRGLDIEMLRFLMGYADTVTSFRFEQVKAEYEKLWKP